MFKFLSVSVTYSQLKKIITTEEALFSIVLNPDQIDGELLWLGIQTTLGLFSFSPLWLPFFMSVTKGSTFSTS